MNIALKELPEDLHRSLCQRARIHGRSLNKEVISILEAVASPVRRSAKYILGQVEERRNRMPQIVKETELKGLIEQGRT